MHKDKEKLCLVCTDLATGIHYSAVTCEGCKGFFRRAVRWDLSSRYVCQRKGNCEVKKRTRYKCKACRFAKCLKAGMVPSLVLNEKERYAMRKLIAENRRRKSEGRPSAHQCVLNNGINDDRLAAFVSAFLRSFENCSVEAGEQHINYTFNILTKLFPSKFRWTKNGSDAPLFAKVLTVHLTRSLQFIESIPEMNQLSLSEKGEILSSRGLELLILRACYRFYTYHPSASERDHFVKKTRQMDTDLGFMFSGLSFLANIMFHPATDSRVTVACLAAYLICDADGHESRPELLRHMNSLKTLIEGVIRKHFDYHLSSEKHDQLLLMTIANLVYLRYISQLFGLHNYLFVNVTNSVMDKFLQYF